MQGAARVSRTATTRKPPGSRARTVGRWTERSPDPNSRTCSGATWNRWSSTSAAPRRSPASTSPFDRLSSEITRVADEDHVVTVCPHGKASRRAARLVASFDGFDGRVESLAPGLEGWDGPTDGERDTRGSGEDVEAPF